MKHCRQAGSISELGLADNPARLSSADTERPIFPLESGYDCLLSPEQQYEQGASTNLSTHEAFVITIFTYLHRYRGIDRIRVHS